MNPRPQGLSAATASVDAYTPGQLSTSPRSERRCPRCKTTLPETAFSSAAAGYCRDCQSDYDRDRRARRKTGEPAPTKVAKAIAREASKVECSVCGHMFSPSGFARHTRMHEVATVVVKPGRRRHKPTKPERERYGPNPESWAAPKPGMVVLEVLDELTPEQLAALLPPRNPHGASAGCPQGDRGTVDG